MVLSIWSFFSSLIRSVTVGTLEGEHSPGEIEKEKIMQLRRQLMLARQQKDEAEQALREERAALETKVGQVVVFDVCSHWFSGRDNVGSPAKLGGAESKTGRARVCRRQVL